MMDSEKHKLNVKVQVMKQTHIIQSYPQLTILQPYLFFKKNLPLLKKSNNKIPNQILYH